MRLARIQRAGGAGKEADASDAVHDRLHHEKHVVVHADCRRLLEAARTRTPICEPAAPITATRQHGNRCRFQADCADGIVSNVCHDERLSPEGKRGRLLQERAGSLPVDKAWLPTAGDCGDYVGTTRDAANPVIKGVSDVDVELCVG